MITSITQGSTNHCPRLTHWQCWPILCGHLDKYWGSYL